MESVYRKFAFSPVGALRPCFYPRPTKVYLISEMQLVQLEHRLMGVIDVEVDSLRIYRLREPRARHVRVLGRDVAFDFREPIVF